MTTAIYAQSGITNWDDANGWNTNPAGGGTAVTNPQSAAYDCYLNGRTVAMNVAAITANLITTAAGSGSAGGGLTASLASATKAITANITAGTTPALTVSNSTNLLTITGNVQGGSSSGAYGITFGSQKANFVLNGNSTGGSAAHGHGIYGVSGTAGNPTVNGNITGGNGDFRGVYLSTTSSEIITVNGQVKGHATNLLGYGLELYQGIVVLGASQDWLPTSAPPFMRCRVRWAGGNKTITLYDATAAAHVLRERATYVNRNPLISM